MTGETTASDPPSTDAPPTDPDNRDESSETRVEAGRVPWWRRRRIPRHAFWVGVIATAAAEIYAVLGLVQLKTFRASTYDLVIFDQAVRAYSRFAPPAIPSRGMSLGRGMDYLQLSDHFSPILAVLSPFYWLHDGPETLIVAQAVLFAAAVPFLWRYTRRALGVAPAYLVSAAYTVSWPITQAAHFDFHEVAFVPLLTAILIERFDAGRHLPAFLALFALLLVKQDMGLLAIGFGCYLAVTGRRRVGVSFALIGVGWTALVRGFVIPSLGGDPDDYWAYGHLGQDTGSAILALLRDPLNALGLLVSEEIKVDTLLLLAWPTLLLCLLSPLTLAAVPLVAERMLADRPLWWASDYHYNAFVVVILFCAGVDGLRRLLARLGRRDDRALMLAWSLAVCAVAATLVPRFALDQLVQPRFYERDARVRAAEEAVALVPSGTVVEVTNSLGPALTHRATVLLWDYTSHGARWVIADTARGEFPFASVDDQRRRVNELAEAGYRAVYAKEGFIVLRRP